MPTVSKITEHLFDVIQFELMGSDPLTIAIKNKLSMKTILQIKACENFAEYTALKQAQHPVSKSTMRQDIADIKEMLHKILNSLSENRLL